MTAKEISIYNARRIRAKELSEELKQPINFGTDMRAHWDKLREALDMMPKTFNEWHYNQQRREQEQRQRQEGQ